MVYMKDLHRNTASEGSNYDLRGSLVLEQDLYLNKLADSNS
jgi:hypothetical protein